MKPNTEGETLVHFMNNNGDIYAYFPNKPTIRDTFKAFSIDEGETSCHKDYFNESKNATDKESLPLRKKLSELGYNLLVKKGHKFFAPTLKW